MAEKKNTGWGRGNAVRDSKNIRKQFQRDNTDSSSRNLGIEGKSSGSGNSGFVQKTGTVPRHGAPSFKQDFEKPQKKEIRGASSEINRGSLRGRRIINEVVVSRSSNLITKQGTSGKEVPLKANYFALTKTPKWMLYHYRIDFSPEVEFIRLRKTLIYQHREVFGSYIFDGEQLFTTKHILNDEKQIDLVCKKQDDGSVYKLTVKYVGIVHGKTTQYLQILNLILRRSMEGLQLQLIGRNYFDSNPKCTINLSAHKLQLWPGYKTSIRQQENNILLCTDLAYKVMRTETIYDILNEHFKSSRNYKESFRKEVIGMIVLTTYKNKTYRVDDIDFKSSPKSTFQTRDGNISYMDYYKKNYNLQIKDKDQPLLISKPTEKNKRGGKTDFIMLIPELCFATGINDSMRHNFDLMRAMSQHTRLVPEERIKRLKAFNARLMSTEKSIEYLKSWNLNLDKELVELKGRILPSEKIVFGGQKRIALGKDADWKGEFKGNTKMYHICNLTNWEVVALKRNEMEAKNFIKLMIESAKGMGMMISLPSFRLIDDDRQSTYVKALELSAQKDPQLIFTVVPNNNSERYACIKRKLYVDRAVPSQVMVLKTMVPKRGKPLSSLLSVATKVAIQVNCKIKGVPWMIDVPLRGLMTVGFDVCHSSRDFSKSYSALVATMDLKVSTSFFSAVSQHIKGQELSHDIALNMGKALQAYRSLHNALPDRIIFYRDGVGEGQLSHVFNSEIEVLRKRLNEIYASAMGPEAKCRLCYIVVTKNVNTRYFLNNNNPPPGTVVDDVITSPESYDFFLVSQSVQEGTVSPTSYNILYDSIDLSADRIQILTYKMTHMYYNFCGTCRVPAMCQYAHKLAFLVGQSIHQAPNSLLEKQLYFL